MALEVVLQSINSVAFYRMFNSSSERIVFRRMFSTTEKRCILYEADYCHSINCYHVSYNTTVLRYSTQTVVHGTNDNKTYYLQYVRDNGDIFNVGDFVYLRSENELPYIARIDKIHKVCTIRQQARSLTFSLIVVFFILRLC